MTKALYRADIDGLRAFAIASVVLFHAGLSFFPSGFVGVDIFFVISGYLIGGILIRDIQDGTFSYADFYARRARRILPALICVIAASCIAGLILMTATELSDMASGATTALLGVSNIKYYLYSDYFNNDSSLLPMLMTWSLGVEEQFYLLFPLLLLVVARINIKRTGQILALVSAISFVSCVLVTMANPKAAMYFLPLRAWELGLGALLAFYHIRHPVSLLPSNHTNWQGATGLALLLLSITIFDKYTPFPGIAAALPVCAALILLHTRASWVNQHLLSARPVVFTGLVSYSWYLWHWPIMAFARIIHASTSSLSLMLALAAASLAIAYCSWRWIEQPFRLARHGAKKTLLYYSTALILILSCTVGLQLSHGFPSRLPASVVAMDELKAISKIHCMTIWGHPLIKRHACLPPDDGRPAVALIGDSHSASLFWGLRYQADKHHMRLLTFSRMACPPLEGMGPIFWAYQPNPGECYNFMRNAIQRITADRSIHTVVVAGNWKSPMFEYYMVMDGPQRNQTVNTLTAIQLGLPRLLDSLTKAGKHVIVVGDTPFFTFFASNKVATEAMMARRWLAGLDSEKYDSKTGIAGYDKIFPVNPKIPEFVRKAANRPNVTYLDLFPLFCNPDGCMYKQNNHLLFWDRDHMTVAGSLKVPWPQLLFY